ncbi:MAG TPA: lysophospholipid acyltransferase family protein [Pyrinomonadaceae bacterium]|jgi:1-acyl-sn-glycerol-3-phosphate acyltransferase|nr:lysophospholipid acyltransferase family protein [Pyrinomonadaceae bacterium]
MKAQAETTVEVKDEAEATAPAPTAAELAVLSTFERFAFGLAWRMNRGGWKRFWTFCQRLLGAGWIHVSTYNLMRVEGLEHVEAAERSRPLLLVANHRSFFDMYVVSTVLFRRTRWRKQLFFPVRGRFFYDTWGGLLVNFVMGWWSMFPPFFAGGDNPKTEQREFDKFSMRLLASLCREGAGNVVGFHPEGKRNKNSDPYSYLRPQPGVGKLIKDARPQVVPVFIAGLGNDLRRQVLGNWRGGEKVRVRFGPALDLSEFYDRRDSARTYTEIASFVMSKIAELGEQDRASFQLEAARAAINAPEAEARP